jgi:hypothetical protein
MPQALQFVYDPGTEKFGSEKELLTALRELRDFYNTHKDSFAIADALGRPLTVERMLGIATQHNRFTIADDGASVIFLQGTGSIEGVIIQDGRVRYDLSELTKKVRYWDLYCRKECFSCEHIGRAHLDQSTCQSTCTKGHNRYKSRDLPEYDPVGPEKCGAYSPSIVGQEPLVPPRTLKTLIEIVCNE